MTCPQGRSPNMGCGCGGNKRRASSPGLVPAQARIQSSSQPRVQANERQALAQQVQDKLRQANGSVQASSASETERKRRIQISLRNRRKSQ